MTANNAQSSAEYGWAVFVEPTDMPGLWNVEFQNGRWRNDLTTGQMKSLVRVGLTLTLCPACRASRWFGEGPCSQCGRDFG